MPHISVFRMSKVLQYSLESIQSWYCDMTRVYWSIYLDLDSGSESTGAERVSETQLGVLRLRRRGGRGGRTEGGDHCFGFYSFAASLTVLSTVACLLSPFVKLLRFPLSHLFVVRRAARCRRRGTAPCLPQSLKSPPQTTLLPFPVSWREYTFSLFVWSRWSSHSRTLSLQIAASGRRNKWN